MPGAQPSPVEVVGEEAQKVGFLLEGASCCRGGRHLEDYNFRIASRPQHRPELSAWRRRAALWEQ